MRRQMQQQPHLVGQEAMATGATALQVQLQLLDAILLVASLTIQFIDRFGIELIARPTP